MQNEAQKIMLQKKSLLDIKKSEISGKKVLVRVDFNVPLQQGRILDDTRILATLPTISYLAKNKAKVILTSHLGRPNGKVEEHLRLKPIAKRLEELVGKQIHTVDNCIGPSVNQKINTLENGEILLLENIRFHKEETTNDPDFSKELTKSIDFFVNDAFGTSHRAHASISGITKYIKGYAGFLLKKELDVLSRITSNPARPFIAIIGGSKISTKIGTLLALSNSVDMIIIGGAMAYPLLKSKGIHIGNSFCENDSLDIANEFLKEMNRSSVKLLLPQDHIVTQNIESNNHITTKNENIPEGFMGVDIGPKTIQIIQQELNKAKTILWNGPLGIFEKDAYAKGTMDTAIHISNLNATSIIGGGDTVAAIGNAGVTKKMTFISTGGGASLEFIEGKLLPGIISLETKQK